MTAPQEPLIGTALLAYVQASVADCPTCIGPRVQPPSPVSKHSMMEMVSQVTVFLNCSIARAVGALVGGQK
jgi:hypothetical protein